MPRWLTLAACLVLFAARPTVAQPGRVTAGPPADGAAAPAGSAYARVEGEAQTAGGAPLRDARLRLRDARFGRIVETAPTGERGRFVFPTLDPGTYILELLGEKQTVLATSGLLHLVAGQTVTAVVKAPADSRLYGLLGHTAPQAAAILGAAAAAGVLATSVTGDHVSPR